jgi:hypothetical protein
MTEQELFKQAEASTSPEAGRLFFAEMLGSNACAVTPFGRTVDIKLRWFRDRESQYDRCDPSPEPSPAPFDGRDLSQRCAWRR